MKVNESTAKNIESLQKYLSGPRRSRGQVPLIVCNDGFTMSVQASSGHYCSPRNDTGPWSSVEIGYPNKIKPLLWDYAEEPGRWTETVYGYVPIEIAGLVVELHGGIKEA